MEVVKKLDKSFLESGAVDIASALFRLWRDHNGLMTEPMVPLSPHLLFNNFDVPENDIPALLFIGNDSLVSKIYGADWASSITPNKQIPDKEVKKLARNGYVEALENSDAVYDFLVCEVQSANKGPIELSYERLILPIHTGADIRFFMTLCLPSRPDLLDGLSCQGHRSVVTSTTSYYAEVGAGSIST